jgi:arylformamidase
MEACNMQTVIDISLAIGPELLVWPNNPPPRMHPTSRLSQGDASNVSEICMGSHTGTHVDPPLHTLDHGATVDRLPLDALIGTVQVLDLTAVAGAIGPADLEAAIPRRAVDRVLFKTRNSMYWRTTLGQFPTDYVPLSPEGAEWIVDHHIRLVGTDFLSIERYGAAGRPVHHTLLRANTVIVEGLDLASVEAGEYTLVCLPLKLLGADGGPARAVLISS